MGWYDDQVVPRFTAVVCGTKAMQRIRRPSLEGLAGTVLEVGFGSGPNLTLYPDAVTRVLAVEPSEVSRGLARRRMSRVAHHPPVDFVGLDGASLPVDDESVDNVLSTFTMCTIPDIDAALREMRRVLRPGGGVFFLEHGLSSDPKVARWQHRLEPIQRRVAGGCHLTRDAPALAEKAGFTIDRLSRFTITGPKVIGTMASGIARKP